MVKMSRVPGVLDQAARQVADKARPLAARLVGDRG